VCCRTGLYVGELDIRDVLVVDDNDSLREGVAEFLRQEGLQVDTACDGCEALERLERAVYAVLLLDYQMPRMNGVEVANELQRFASRPLVLVMTGYDDVDRLPLDGSIVQAILKKPFELAEVAPIIHACVAELRSGVERRDAGSRKLHA